MTNEKKTTKDAKDTPKKAGAKGADSGSSGPSAAKWLGFDLGGTKMLSVVLDDELQPLGQKRRRTRGNDGAKSGVKRIIQTIEQSLEEAKTDLAEIAGIGVGSPGPVDTNQGVVLEMVNLGWHDVPLRKLLEDAFQKPVVVLNDVDAGVYGEYVAGAAQGSSTALGIFPGTGIGGGCVLHGEIVSGKGVSAMEVGHIQIEPDGDYCGCGRRGCLETRSSRLAIAAQAALAAYRGTAPFLAKEVGSDLSEIRSGVLAKSIKNGDVVIERIVRQAAQDLGIAIASMIHLLAPDRIVLGGGMVEAMEEIWVEEVTKSARRRVMAPYRDTFDVVTATLGDYATAVGASAWIRKQVLRGSAPTVAPKAAAESPDEVAAADVDATVSASDS